LRGIKAAIETFANKIGSAPAALTAQFGRNDSCSSFSNAEEKARHESHFGASASMGEPAKKGGAANGRRQDYCKTAEITDRRGRSADH
jgi:hypothetical protein